MLPVIHIRIHHKGGCRYVSEVEDDDEMLIVDHKFVLNPAATHYRQFESYLNADAQNSAAMDHALVRNYGQWLHDCLFGTQNELHLVLQHPKYKNGAAFRLHLRPELGSLWQVSWEYLWNAAHDGLPYLLRPGYSIRRTSRRLSRITLEKFKGKLRLLVLVCNPRDLEDKWRLDSLDVDREREVITRAVNEKGVLLEQITECNLTTIRYKVQEFAPHVIHIVCHGVVDGRGNGALLLESLNEKGECVSGDALWASIVSPSVRLVVLPGCSTGRTSSANVFGGVATALLRNGLPSVLATQHPVSDAVGHCLAEALYNELAGGSTVEEAVTQARLHVKDQEGLERAAWGVMAHWTRADGDYHLVAPQARRVEPGAKTAAEADEAPSPPRIYITPNRAYRDLKRVIKDRHVPFVLLRGVSGAGKTTLVDRVCAELESSPPVYRVRCWAQPDPVTDLLTQARRFIQQHAGEAALEQFDRAADRSAVLEAVKGWAKAARGQKVVFIIDAFEFALRPERNGKHSLADARFEVWIKAILQEPWGGTTFLFISRHHHPLIFDALINGTVERVTLDGLERGEALRMMERQPKSGQAPRHVQMDAIYTLGGTPLSLWLLENCLQRNARTLGEVVGNHEFWEEVNHAIGKHMVAQDYDRLSPMERKLLHFLAPSPSGKGDFTTMKGLGYTEEMLHKLESLGLVDRARAHREAGWDETPGS
jgi:hypothetical protein